MLTWDILTTMDEEVRVCNVTDLSNESKPMVPAGQADLAVRSKQSVPWGWTRT